MSAQEKFWHWFVQHEVELFGFDPDREIEREKLFDELASALQEVDPNLAFEFGPKGTKREFVISAAGIKEVFPAVAALVAAAPPLSRWKVTAFRPRRDPVNVIQFRGKQVDPKDVCFSLLDNGKMAGIHLFVPGFREDDVDLKQIGYLLLDEALGEYDVEWRVGLIRMLPPEIRTEGPRYPLAELPLRFDELVHRLEKHTRTM
jgi:hypothetical protein